MTMPKKNYFFEDLPENAIVELRKTTDKKNSYYVAIINKVPGVVTMTGHKQKEQQEALNKMVKANEDRIDQAMVKKGYVYKLVPLNSDIAPLFAKDVIMVDDLQKDWAETKFQILHWDGTKFTKSGGRRRTKAK